MPIRNWNGWAVVACWAALPLALWLLAIVCDANLSGHDGDMGTVFYCGVFGLVVLPSVLLGITLRWFQGRRNR